MLGDSETAQPLQGQPSKPISTTQIIAMWYVLSRGLKCTAGSKTVLRKRQPKIKALRMQ